MSIVHVPNTRDYWGEVTGTHLIKTTMTVNQYEQIRKFLHFNDNSAMIPRGEKGHDRLFKIRPIIELMRSRFQTIPVEECVSVDEQICSTKARSYLKQYMPNKPHKYGYKLFVISGISGYAYDYEIFTGDENEPEKRVTGEEDLGASANVVVRLSRILPRNMNHKLYCDNYYTSLPLLVWLHKQGIYSLGTVRRNRVPDCKLPSEAELKKMARGASVERVATVDGVDISNVVWKDNKSVMLLSTLAGQQPIHEAGRYDKKTKSRITIPCPQIIKLYNKHMGGVDLLDSIMGRHKILVKSRKWYIRLFYHLLDMGVVNSWLLYRRVAETKGIRRTMKLSEFRMEIAHCLCRSGQTSAKRGRPSNELENQIQAKKTKGPTAHVPPQDVRLDQQMQCLQHAFGAKIIPIYSATSVGEYTLATKRNAVTSFIKRTYLTYFGMPIGDQDKTWAPHMICETCSRYLCQCTKGKKSSLKFGIPMVWRELPDVKDDDATSGEEREEEEYSDVNDGAPTPFSQESSMI
ncbi:piggyBac transposable element-derived protein 2-like [Schistocerca piceifrons]|uniref:piggyBac transposable element-derived protein 2-like n=1 Tax=Schistocerca piceifrons TaxID=274613 RepID=UPI001F5F5280|nr:piggyBac transposable element-derived protein 2-like [Schistocerca piceifrons]